MNNVNKRGIVKTTMEHINFIIQGTDSDLTENEILQVRNLNSSEVFPSLYQLVLEWDGVKSSKALKAILYLEKFDTIGFLVQHILSHADDRDLFYMLIPDIIERDFPNTDDRITPCLTLLLSIDEDPYMRNRVLELLRIYGDERALALLQKISENDHSIDELNYKVSDLAESAIQGIEHRMK